MSAEYGLIEDFDLGFFSGSNNPSIDAEKLEKQRRAILIAKQKTIATDSLLKKYYEKKDALDLAEKTLFEAKLECKQVCIDYKNAVEKISYLEENERKQADLIRELDEKQIFLGSQYNAIQSHANQLQELVRDQEKKITELEDERDFEKIAFKGSEKSVISLKKDKVSLKKLISRLKSVVLGNGKLDVGTLGQLKRYKMDFGESDDGASLKDCEEHSDVNDDEIIAHHNKSGNNETDLESDILFDVDACPEITSSVDTGCGSSLDSDSEKGLQSPDYIPDHVKPLVKSVSCQDAATSPIQFINTTSHESHEFKKPHQAPPCKQLEVEPIPEIFTAPKNIRTESDCLEENNSRNFSEDYDDTEVANILKEINLHFSLVTPIPPSPSYSIHTDRSESYTHRECPEAAKIREENKALQSSVADLAKQVLEIKTMLSLQPNIVCQKNVAVENNAPSDKSCNKTNIHHRNSDAQSTNAVSNITDDYDYDNYILDPNTTLHLEAENLDDDNSCNLVIGTPKKSLVSEEIQDNINPIATNTEPIKIVERITFVDNSDNCEDPVENELTTLNNKAEDCNINVVTLEKHSNERLSKRVRKGKVTKLEKMRSRLMPKSKIKSYYVPPVNRKKRICVKSNPNYGAKQQPKKINIHSTSSDLNDKAVYEKALAVAAKIRAKNKKEQDRPLRKRSSLPRKTGITNKDNKVILENNNEPPPPHSAMLSTRRNTRRSFETDPPPTQEKAMPSPRRLTRRSLEADPPPTQEKAMPSPRRLTRRSLEADPPPTQEKAMPSPRRLTRRSLEADPPPTQEKALPSPRRLTRRSIETEPPPIEEKALPSPRRLTRSSLETEPPPIEEMALPSPRRLTRRSIETEPPPIEEKALPSPRRLTRSSLETEPPPIEEMALPSPRRLTRRSIETEPPPIEEKALPSPRRLTRSSLETEPPPIEEKALPSPRRHSRRSVETEPPLSKHIEIPNVDNKSCSIKSELIFMNSKITTRSKTKTAEQLQVHQLKTAVVEIEKMAIPNIRSSKPLKRLSSEEFTPEFTSKRQLRSSLRTTINVPDVTVTSPHDHKSPVNLRNVSNDPTNVTKDVNDRDEVQDYGDIDMFLDSNCGETVIVPQLPQNGKSDLRKDSILCKMIEKYGRCDSRRRPRERGCDVSVKKIYEQIKQGMELAINAPANEVKIEMNSLVNNIKNMQYKYFMQAFMKYLNDPERKTELLSMTCTPPLPPLSKSEQILIYVVSQVNNHWEGVSFINELLHNIEYHIFRLNKTPDFDAIESMSHFYAVLCRFTKAKNKLRTFMLDAMYCIGYKAVPLIKQVINVWMHVLPLPHMRTAKNPLVICIIYLLHFYKCDDRQHRVQEMRNLLMNRYSYDLTEWSEKKVIDHFKTSILEMKENEAEMRILRSAILIYGKRLGARWCEKNIIKNLLVPIIMDKNNTERVHRFCISLLGPLIRPFPADMKVHSEIVMNQLIDLLDQDLSYALKEAVYSSLMYINRHNQHRVTKVLLEWHPEQKISKELEEQLRIFVQEKPLAAWTNILSRPM